MGHFHKTKEIAQRIVEERGYKDDPRIREVRVQFEPYAGWVIVLFAAYHDLSEFVNDCEVHDGRGKQKLTGQLGTKPVPVTKEDGTPLRSRSQTQGGYTPDATWKVMDELHAAGKGREEIIAALVSSGVDSKKASKETRHWMKARGMWKKD